MGRNVQTRAKGKAGMLKFVQWYVYLVCLQMTVILHLKASSLWQFMYCKYIPIEYSLITFHGFAISCCLISSFVV